MTTEKGSERYIGVLDGIRALAMIMVVWFHIWEQSWLTPYFDYPNGITKYIGINRLDLHVFVRCGYTTVEMLILLSAVVNFLPYARSMIYGEPWPDLKTFYKKRAIRILPSYLLCVLVMFVAALIEGSYGGDVGYLLKDLLTHLTFTSTFFRQTYRSTKLNGALWTVQVEVLYYLVIPFLARAFKRFPALTTGGLYLVGLLSANILVNHAEDLWANNNFVLTFAEFYANGMLVALLYCMIKKAALENRYTQIAGTLALLGAFLSYVRIGYEFMELDRPYAQLTKRFALSLVMSLFVLGAMFALPAVKAFFSNRVFRFLSGISYNLYIWHQVVATFLKNHRIPYWEGNVAPNERNDTVWMRHYFVLAVVDALLVAVALTYLFEKPVSRYLSARFLGPRDKTAHGKKEPGQTEHEEI